MKRLVQFVCATLPALMLAVIVAGCGGTPTPARIPTNTPPATLTATPTSAPTNTPLPKPTNTPAPTNTPVPTNPPATAAATKPSASATAAPATATTKPTSAPTATTAAATKPTSAPTAAATTGQSGTNTSSTGTVAKDMCLACHGPFSKLAASTANYEAPSGEKGSPHLYVPHTSTDASKVPECSNCHTPHPVPPTAGAKPTPANVDWCYQTCHHENDFTPCKQCHN